MVQKKPSGPPPQHSPPVEACQQGLKPIHLLYHFEGHILVDDAVCAISTSANAGRLIAGVVALELLADLLDVAVRKTANGGSVSVVRVDASNQVAVRSRNVRDDDVPLVHVVTVATGSVKLSKGLDSEARDGQSSGAVVLKNLKFPVLVFRCV